VPARLASIGVPGKILVRGVNWLGDAVMTTPGLLRLREHFPRAQITLLCPRYLSELWLHHPAIDKQFSFERGENLWSIARRVRPGSYDLALVLPNSPRSALEVWLSGIPHRLGYARPWRNWFLTAPIPPRQGCVSMRKKSAHEIRRLVKADITTFYPNLHGQVSSAAHQVYEYLHLAAALGANPAMLAPKLEVGAEEVSSFQATWSSRIAETSPGASREGQSVWLGMCPSAAYGPAKCWPFERFAAVTQEVAQRVKNSIWLLFGTRNDWGECERIRRLAGGRVLNIAGQTSLRELMVLLKLCRVVLTNDSGPMHVAAALGTPVVVPFGSTTPELTGPGLPGDTRNELLRSDAVCSPCFRRTCPVDFRCMTGISVEQVVDAILNTLGR